MRSIVFNRYGSSKELDYVDLPIPTISATEILVNVKACGLNPVDYKIRNGDLKELFKVDFPRILGGDISGVVVKVGLNVKDIVVGDEVYFSNPLDRNGGYAEFCAVDASLVEKKPSNLSHIEAASLPVAGLTSIQSLRDFGQIGKNQNVLIHAGAGGVGSFAIQYAKLLGAKVFTTASKTNEAYVRELGADIVIDYKNDDFVDVCQRAGGMNIILESIGGENYIRSLRATRNGGFLPCIVNPPDEDTKVIASKNGIKTDFFLLTCSKEDLNEMRILIESEKIMPSKIEVLEWGDIQLGHEKLESGRTRGKLVLKI